jgi:Flp pilus assembly protein TadG
MRRERGAAAVEMALFILLLTALLAIVWPAVGAMIEQVKLGRSAGTAAAFATSVPDQKRRACGGAQLLKRSPSAEDVEAEARCARFGTPDGGVGDMVVTVSPDPASATTRPGDKVSVTVERTISLGPLGALFDRPDVTLHATVVRVKE